MVRDAESDAGQYVYHYCGVSALIQSSLELHYCFDFANNAFSHYNSSLLELCHYFDRQPFWSFGGRIAFRKACLGELLDRYGKGAPC